MLRITLLFMCATVLTACLGGTSRPSNFYALSPLSSNAPSESHPGNISLVVDVDEFPGYLANPQMARKTSDNQLVIDEYERWAEDLKKNFERTLFENLSTILNSPYVYLDEHGSEREAQYKVKIDVLHFEIEPSGQAHLKARWDVLNRGRDVRGMPRITEFYVQVDAPTRKAEVQALSQALGKFSQEIAAALGGQG